MYLGNISVLAKKWNLSQIRPQTLQIYKHYRNRRTCHMTRQRGGQQTVGNYEKGQPFPANTLKEKEKWPIGKRDVREITECDVLKFLAFCFEQCTSMHTGMCTFNRWAIITGRWWHHRATVNILGVDIVPFFQKEFLSCKDIFWIICTWNNMSRTEFKII